MTMARVLPCCVTALTLVAAQPGVDPSTEAFLRATAGFGEPELAAARAGQRVVKTLDPGIAKEMVTVGVTRFEIPFDYYVERARQGDLYRVGPPLIEIGKFSPTPAVADMAGLKLEQDDLAPIREMDAEAGKSERAAKEFFVRLIRNYQREGVRSLAKLQQGSRRLVVANEVRALMANSTYLRRYGERVEEYVANYPLGNANGAVEYFAWAKVNIGLQKLVRLTKVTVWVLNGARHEAVIVTEQLYANRYFQASLQVDHVTGDEGDARKPAVYLMTVNRGRCDLLEGAVARLFRPFIVQQTRASTERTLDLAKATLEGEYRLLAAQRFHRLDQGGAARRD